MPTTPVTPAVTTGQKYVNPNASSVPIVSGSEPDATNPQPNNPAAGTPAVILSTGLAKSAGVPVGTVVPSGTIITPSASAPVTKTPPPVVSTPAPLTAQQAFSAWLMTLPSSQQAVFNASNYQNVWNTIYGNNGQAAAIQAMINLQALNASAAAINSGAVATTTITPTGGVTTTLPSGTQTKSQATTAQPGIVTTVPVPTVTPPSPTAPYYVFQNKITGQNVNVSVTQYNSWNQEQQFAFQQSLGLIPSNANIAYNPNGTWGYSLPQGAVYTSVPAFTKPLLDYLRAYDPDVYAYVQQNGTVAAMNKYADIINGAVSVLNAQGVTVLGSTGLNVSGITAQTNLNDWYNKLPSNLQVIYNSVGGQQAGIAAVQSAQQAALSVLISGGFVTKKSDGSYSVSLVSPNGSIADVGTVNTAFPSMTKAQVSTLNTQHQDMLTLQAQNLQTQIIIAPYITTIEPGSYIATHGGTAGTFIDVAAAVKGGVPDTVLLGLGVSNQVIQTLKILDNPANGLITTNGFNLVKALQGGYITQDDALSVGFNQTQIDAAMQVKVLPPPVAPSQFKNLNVLNQKYASALTQLGVNIPTSVNFSQFNSIVRGVPSVVQAQAQKMTGTSIDVKGNLLTNLMNEYGYQKGYTPTSLGLINIIPTANTIKNWQGMTVDGKVISITSDVVNLVLLLTAEYNVLLSVGQGIMRVVGNIQDETVFSNTGKIAGVYKVVRDANGNLVSNLFLNNDGANALLNVVYGNPETVNPNEGMVYAEKEIPSYNKAFGGVPETVNPNEGMVYEVKQVAPYNLETGGVPETVNPNESMTYKVYQPTLTTEQIADKILGIPSAGKIITLASPDEIESVGIQQVKAGMGVGAEVVSTPVGEINIDNPQAEYPWKATVAKSVGGNPYVYFVNPDAPVQSVLGGMDDQPTPTQQLINSNVRTGYATPEAQQAAYTKMSAGAMNFENEPAQTTNQLNMGNAVTVKTEVPAMTPEQIAAMTEAVPEQARVASVAEQMEQFNSRIEPIVAPQGLNVGALITVGGVGYLIEDSNTLRLVQPTNLQFGAISTATELPVVTMPNVQAGVISQAQTLPTVSIPKTNNEPMVEVPNQQVIETATPRVQETTTPQSVSITPTPQEVVNVNLSGNATPTPPEVPGGVTTKTGTEVTMPVTTQPTPNITEVVSPVTTSPAKAPQEVQQINIREVPSNQPVIGEQPTSQVAEVETETRTLTPDELQSVWDVPLTVVKTLSPDELEEIFNVPYVPPEPEEVEAPSKEQEQFNPDRIIPSLPQVVVQPKVMPEVEMPAEEEVEQLLSAAQVQGLQDETQIQQIQQQELAQQMEQMREQSQGLNVNQQQQSANAEMQPAVRQIMETSQQMEQQVEQLQEMEQSQQRQQQMQQQQSQKLQQEMQQIQQQQQQQIQQMQQIQEQQQQQEQERAQQMQQEMAQQQEQEMEQEQEEQVDTDVDTAVDTDTDITTDTDTDDNDNGGFPPIILPSSDSQTPAQKRFDLFKGSLGWKSGFGYWCIKFPYRSKKDIAFFRNKPVGFKEFKGRGGAYQTIQQLTGHPPSKSLFVNMGIMNVIVEKPSYNVGAKGAIRFKPNKRAMKGHSSGLVTVR